MNPQFLTRHLTTNDIPQLLRLEQKKWDPHQCANAETMRSRILQYPMLCVGVFCAVTGDAYASLFMKPTSRHEMAEVRNWADYENSQQDVAHNKRDCLFGVSMTSMHPQAIGLMVDFLLPYALKNCWYSIYLGSPMPGLHKALLSNPALDPRDYAFSKHAGAPQDPQLRYYYSMGFKDLITIVPNYFPHARSLNYGALLHARVPLSELCFIWQFLSLPWIQSLIPLLDTLYKLLPRRPSSKSLKTSWMTKYFYANIY
jgi:hypothetical protein